MDYKAILLEKMNDLWAIMLTDGSIHEEMPGKIRSVTEEGQLYLALLEDMQNGRSLKEIYEEYYHDEL